MNKKQLEKQDEVIFMRINKDLKKKLNDLAVKDQRSLADYIRIQLSKLIK